MGRTALSALEVRRAEVLSRVKEGKIKLRTAAEMMRISYRQAKRIWKRYRRAGAKGLAHGNAGKPSHRAKPARLRGQVLGLIRNKYSGGVGERFGPTLAAEHLASEDGLQIDAETLRRWMLEEGLWSRERKRKSYRKRRERKEHFGELVQMDGSFEHWLEDRGPESCLMNMVDDATGTTLCRLGEQETTWAAANLLRRWIDKHGIPGALYTDWKNVYVRQPTAREELAGKPAVTQFGRMCARLGIKIIAASSPQAKGRVERNHGTHQDRLIKKLRRKQISSLAAANQFLEEQYLQEHNRRYARPPASNQDFHRPTPGKRHLQEVFCLEQERVLSNDWVVQYARQLLQVERQSRHHAPARSKVTVREWEDGRLQLRYRGHSLAWQTIESLPVQPKAESSPTLPHPKPHPASYHPWRQSYQGMSTPHHATHG